MEVEEGEMEDFIGLGYYMYCINIGKEYNMFVFLISLNYLK